MGAFFEGDRQTTCLAAAPWLMAVTGRSAFGRLICAGPWLKKLIQMTRPFARTTKWRCLLGEESARSSNLTPLVSHPRLENYFTVEECERYFQAGRGLDVWPTMHPFAALAKQKPWLTARCLPNPSEHGSCLFFFFAIFAFPFT